ncbi:MAG: DNA polymerase IV [Schwartzia succinivorans]|uniref:DNA polymerase IV n=1 Tax=Schwartzia succinivorans TaxID=55507 RepID=UPI0023558DD7|nr:DNA polymerase IV [Schwartzia succinivorans]MBE6097544.1 DNA polymerase IV [Schwartzia succinivorans]
MDRWILHVDMDAFFASVEQRDHEEYRGKPVIVGGLGPRGVVSTASYEARRYGVHSAMPMATARRLCRDGIFLSGSYETYRAVSKKVFSILSRFSPVIEPLSIDEGFLDITGMEGLMESRREYGLRLKKEIFEATGLVASVGIAPNKFLAKLASDLEKPDGLVIIEKEDIMRVLSPLPVRRIWGVGKKMNERLALLGIKTIGELANTDIKILEENLGTHAARQLYELSHGIDNRPVEPEREVKSIGREETFTEDIYKREDIDKALLYLAEQVGWRLRKAGTMAHTIQLKIRFGDFSTYTRRKTMEQPTAYDEEIYETAKELCSSVTMPRGMGVRLLGISGSGLGTSSEISLFSARDTQKKEKLYGAIDDLKARFGEGIVTKGNLIK